MSADKRAAAKKSVWVPDPKEGYVLGEVLSTDEAKKTTTVRVMAEDRVVPTAKLEDVNPRKFDKVEDMSNMGFLSEATVLHNLKERYFANMIYTYSGLFLVAINPFKDLPLYTNKVVERYKGKRRTEIEPHVFALADMAYRQMMENRENQSMLITGESGAGKTVNTKKVLQYLAAIAGKKTGAGGRGELEEQIIMANPILEAWGNAKTIRNDNSSRFGKFIEIQFSYQGMIAGGVIDSYLLEKSRVTFQAKKERNYHVFYYLLKGAPADLKAQLKLGRVEDYNWLIPDSQNVPGFDDVAEFQGMEAAFEKMGVPKEEVIQLYKITSAVLHMGNAGFRFTENKRSEEAMAPADCEAELRIVEELLGCDPGSIQSAVLRPRMKAGTEWVNKSRNQGQAKNLMEALAKAIYERMFLWIVQRINHSLENREKRELFIGVLDISGFEIFEINSFEQLCINYTNERLQQFFNNHMFKLEQEEYLREQIEWKMIDFGLDLQSTIDLIEASRAPLGVLSVLEEQCQVPKATDETLVAKLKDVHDGKHPNFKVPKFSKVKFSIVHYAGTVEYLCDDWLEKNRDKLDDPIAVVMQDSKSPFIAALFEDLNPPREGVASSKREDGAASGKKKPRPFVSVAHKAQLEHLMEKLRSTSPHFIRCIKPNEEKRPGLIDSPMVLDQLRCNGVLEGIRICRKGYPNRLRFDEFRNRYKVCAAGKVPDSLTDSKEATRIILEAVQMPPEMYKIGLSKVFFKAGKIPELEELRDEILGKLLTSFQSLIRGYWARNKMEIIRETTASVQVIQSGVRNFLRLKDWGWWQLFAKMRPMVLHKKEADEKAAIEKMLQEEQEKRKQEELARQSMMQDFEQLQLAMAEKEAAQRKEREALENERLRAQQEAELREKRLEEERQRQLREKEKEMKRLAEKNEEERKALEAKLRAEADRIKLEKDEEARRLAEEARRERERLDAERQAELERLKKIEEAERLALEGKKREAEANAQRIQSLLKAQMEETGNVEERARRLDEKRKQLEKELAGLLHDLDDERSNRTKSEEQRRTLEAELRALRDQLAQEGSDRTILESAKKSTEQELDKLRANLRDKDEEVSRAEKLKKDIQRDLDELQERFDSEEKARANADRVSKANEKELKALQARLEDEAKKNADLAKRNKKLEADVKSGTLNRSNSGNIGSSLDLNVKKLEKEARELKEKLAVAEGQAQSALRSKKSTQQQCEELEENLAEENKQRIESDRKAKQLEEDVRELTEQLEDEQRAREAIEAERSRKDMELEELQRHLLAAGEEHEKDLDSKRAKFQEQIDQLRDQLDNAAREKTSFEKQYKKATQEMSDLKRELEEAQRGGGGSSKNTKKLELQVGQLTEKLGEAERNLNSANFNLKKITDERQTLLSQIDDANREKTKAQKRAKSLEGEMLSYKEQLEEESRNRNAAQSQLRTMEQELKEAQEKFEDEQDISQRLKEELGRLREDFGALQKRSGSAPSQGYSEEFEKDLSALRQRVQELTDLLDEERRKRAVAERACRQALNEVDELKDQLDLETSNRQALADAKRMLETDIKALRDQLSKEQEISLQGELELKKLDAKLSDMSHQLGDEAGRKDKALAGLKEKSQRVKELEDALEDQRNVVESVERSKRVLEDEVANLKEEVQEQVDERQRVEEARRKQFEELTALRNQLDNNDDPHVQRLEEERRAALLQVDDLQLQLDNAKREITRLAKEAKSGTPVNSAVLVEEQTKRRNAVKAMKKAKADAKKLALELTSARKRVENLEQDLHTSNSKLEDFKARYDVLEKKVSGLEFSKAQLMNQIEDLKDNLQMEQEAKQLQIQKRQKAEAEAQQGLVTDTSTGQAVTVSIDDIKREHILRIAEVKKEMSSQFAQQLESVEESKRQLRDKMDSYKEKLEEADRERNLLQSTAERAQKEAEESRSRLEEEIRGRVDLEKSNRSFESEKKDLLHRLGLAESSKLAITEEKDLVNEQYRETLRKVEEFGRLISVLEREKSSAKSDVENLKDELDRLTKARNEVEERFVVVRAELDELKERNAEQQTQRSEWEEERKRITDELYALKEQSQADRDQRQEELEESRRKLLKDVKDLSDRCENEEKAKMTLEKNLRRLESDRDNMNEQLSDVRRSQVEAEASQQRLQVDLQTARQRLEEETRLRAELEVDKKRFEMDNKELRDTMGDAQRGQESASRKRAMAEERLQQAVAEAAESAVVNDTLQQTIRNLQTEISTLLEKLDVAENDSRTGEDVRLKAQSQLQDMANELMRTDNANAVLEKQNVQLTRDVLELRARYEGAGGKVKGAGDAIRLRLEDKLIELSRRLTEESKAKMDQQKSNRKLEREIREAKKKEEEETKLRERAEKQLRKAENTNQKQQNEIDDLAQKLASAETAKNKALRDIASWADEKKHLKSEVERYRERCEQERALAAEIHRGLTEVL